MEVKKLKVKNVGILGDIDLNIDKPMILFYGDIQQGKTTLLNAIRWLAGGKAVSIPKDLIRHGEKEASIELGLDHGKIRREFYIDKEGNLKAKKLEAVLHNNILTQEQVTLLFNPFLLDQNHFTNMNAGDKIKFLLETFGVDTSDQDSAIKEKMSQAKELRTKIKMYGEIDLTEVVKPDIEGLNKKEAEIREKLNAEILKIREKNSKIRVDHEENLTRYYKELTEYNKQSEIKNKIIIAASDCLINLRELGYKGSEVQEFINELPSPIPFQKQIPVEPSMLIEEVNQSELTAIQAEISEAKAGIVLYDQYQEKLKKQAEKEADELCLKAKESSIKELRSQKAEKLQVISGKIEGLEFNELGEFTYLGTSSGMLSDSQQMELSSKLSTLYPEGLKIELIDRGESLGKSVFDLVDHAKENDRSVLVTIVGDTPSKVPEEIGVFVVDKGEIQQKQLF